MTNKSNVKSINNVLLAICSVIFAACFLFMPLAFAEENQTDAVQISSEADFINFARNCAEYDYSVNKTFMLTVDLNFANIYAPSIPVFNGVFDGQNHTIYNFTLNEDKDNVSVFKRLNGGAEIKNLKFKNLDIKSSNGSYASLIARNYGSVINVETSGVIDGEQYSGGITAYNGSGAKIENCINNCDIYCILNGGGIAGFNSGDIIGCTNKGKINTFEVSTSNARNMTNVGGIAGYSTGKLINCANDGKIGYIYQGRYIGGVAGLCNGEVYFCNNNAEVYGNNYVGGIFGYYGRLQNDSDSNDYLQDWLDRYFGKGNDNGEDDDFNFEESVDLGIHKISYCCNTGAVTAENYAGGITGCLNAINAILKNSFANCQIFAHTNYAGGIAAEQLVGRIESCSVSGSVENEKGNYTGGIAGLSSTEIYACTCNARIEGNDYVGGIAGKANDLQNCYTNATIISNGQYTGNITGFSGTGSAISVTNVKHNYFIGDGFGIDGVNYGAATEYSAAKLTADALSSQNTLSQSLVGFNEDFWIADQDKLSYPMLKSFAECNAEDNYEDFATWFENAKSKFTEQSQFASSVFVKVVFWQWDESQDYKYYTSVSVPYGQGITELPALPEIDGYFVWWEEKDLSSVTQDVNVYQQVDKYLTTITSDDGQTPQFIAEGKFYSDTTLKAEKDGNAYIIKLLREGKEISYDTLVIKYFTNGETDYDLTINGKSAKFSASGKYITFNLSQNQSFCIDKKAPVNHLWLYIGIGAGGAVIIAVSTWLIVRKTRKKRKLNNNK